MGGTSKPSATADFSRYDTTKSTLSTTSAISDIKDSSSNVSGDGNQDLVLQTTTEPPKPKPEAVQTEPGPEPEDVDMKTASDEQENRTSTEPDANQPAGSQPPAENTPQPPASTTTWLGGWWGRPNAEPVSPQPAIASEPASREPAIKGTADPAPETKPLGSTLTEAEPANAGETEDGVSKIAEAPAEQSTTHENTAPATRDSWLWYWSANPSVPPCAEPAKESEDAVMQDAPPIEAAPAPESATEPAPASTSSSASVPKAGSTWAFWSRDPGSKGSSKQPAQQDDQADNQGQLAVMGESSENKPKRTNSTEFKGVSGGKEPPASGKEPPVKSDKKENQGKATAAIAPKAASLRRSKRDRPESMDIDDATPVRPSTPKTEPPAKAGAAPKTPTSAKSLQQNLILPSFDSTYKPKENPSIYKQIARLLIKGRQAPARHVYVTKDFPKIKKALAIGVHGLFPATYLRPMIGQPTGTSIKFANHAAEAIRRWADKNGCGDCEIEKVALEGEGKIGERVENLWKLLLNWIDQIRSADVIIIGCHSQGVPVSIMLLAKLIELGVVNSARVGVCAMAGVSLGPFPDYKTGMGYLMGSAAELWAFADPQSEVSKRLEVSLKAILEYGARVTFIGSIDDQLVPLESSTYTPAHHPYIFRAAFIDGRIHAPDFIAHLVGFALKLRNLGVSDHGLIRELSTPLAGSLYSGEGHSRLYDDERVYDLAVSHALETTDVSGPVVPCEVQHRPPGNSNPYHLPWIFRGLLEEDLVKTELSDETAELVKQFDEWKPVTKALKDVKYRLEAVQSKL